MSDPSNILDFNTAARQSELDDRPSPLRIALGYAERGWPVFPCNPLNKRPLTEHGFKEATTDKFKIRSWWLKAPNAMVGIPTGSAAGFWVLDIDTDTAKGKDGVGSLAVIGHDLSELMDTVVSRTGSGGYHCLFRHIDGITNARGNLPRHIDVRGEGGYIIAAGSVLSDGRAYEWLNPPDENEIADAPDWLLGLIHAAPVTNPLDFNTARPERPNAAERAVLIEPGTWHEKTRDLVARLVREGASNESIAALAPHFTEPGYTADQTVFEFLRHAQTAREKWGYQPKAEPPEAPTSDRPLIPIYSRQELRELKPPKWLVRKVIVERSVLALYGPSGSLKSFVAIDLAMSVATGTDWHDRTVTSGPVVYVTGEGRDQIDKRLTAWERARGYAGTAPIFIVPLGIAISEPAWVGALIQTIETTVPAAPAMIWLDTLARTFGSGDENSQKDMNAFVAGVDRLRDHFNATVGIVHHTGKEDTRGLRGSSALYAAMDTVIRTDRRAGKKLVTLKNQQPHGKQKDAPEFDDIAFEARVVELGQADDEGEEMTSLALFPADVEASEEAEEQSHKPLQARPQGANQLAVIAALKKAKREPLGINRIITMARLNNARAFEAVNSLVAKGLVTELETERGKQWVLA